jgi:hypothetical protein
MNILRVASGPRAAFVHTSHREGGKQRKRSLGSPKGRREDRIVLYTQLKLNFIRFLANKTCSSYKVLIPGNTNHEHCNFTGKVIFGVPVWNIKISLYTIFRKLIISLFSGRINEYLLIIIIIIIIITGKAALSEP